MIFIGYNNPVRALRFGHEIKKTIPEVRNRLFLRAKNDTGRTFSASHELPKQVGATGIQLYSHMKFLNLQRFDEEWNRLVWVSTCYEVNKGNIAISGMSAFFE